MQIETIRPLRFINIGDDPPKDKKSIWIGRRQWEACLRYNFISAGQGRRYSQPLTKLIVGDIVAAYKTGKGYVGIGRVLSSAMPIKDFKFNNYTLDNLDIDINIKNGSEKRNYKYVNELPFLRKSIFENACNDKTEFAVQLKWLNVVRNPQDAFWEKNKNLFASRSTQCTLENQPDTIKFLEKAFDVKFVKKICF